METITLAGDYGYGEYWIGSAALGTTVNATTADWHIAADESEPAINIFDSSGVVIDGGEIWGEVSQTGDWKTIYNHMATGFRVSNSPNTTIRNVHIDKTWDGIRFVPDDSLLVANGSSNGWLIEDVWLSNIRDDAIENDFAHTGTLRDSLLDGVFSGFGTVNTQSAHGVVTVDDSIIIMKDFLKDGEMTHGSPFKFNTSDPQNNPDLKIFNTIIAVQDPVHNGLSRLKEAWSNLTESSGNYFLNLSDKPFPSNYPLPPKGFTILQGQAARDFLANEKSKWLAEHSAAEPPTDPIPAEPTPTTGQVITGTDTGNDLTGTSGDDFIYGLAGDDRIFGMEGNDTLSGGTGNDRFYFNTKDGAVDTITDFTAGSDQIRLQSDIYTSLGNGGRKLNSAFLSTDGAAHDRNDYIIYNPITGGLFYDADGSGSGATVQIALLGTGLKLSSSDFYVEG